MVALIGAIILLAAVAWVSHRVGVENGKWHERARHLAAIREDVVT